MDTACLEYCLTEEERHQFEEDGYLIVRDVLPADLVARWRGRILNIHPALLPKFGGKGLFGMAVHRAVLAAGEEVTGVTVHLADERFDHGPIVAQCQVSVVEGDTVETLMDRVQKRERLLWVETLQSIVRRELNLDAIG